MLDWKKWDGLQSNAERGQSTDPERFPQLRDQHVFLYAGPSCYYCAGCTGDAVLYFSPEAEAGHQGCVSPFDSGALEDSPPRLQPYRSQDASESQRWAFFEQHRQALEGWRAHFATWLTEMYDDPDCYLDSQADRYAAGQPERTDPPELLEHNGSAGRDRYGEGNCGDRRSWLWEVRIKGRLPYTHIAALSFAYDSYETAADFAEELAERTGERPLLRSLHRNTDPQRVSQSLYERSGDILKELVNS